MLCLDQRSAVIMQYMQALRIDTIQALALERGQAYTAGQRLGVEQSLILVRSFNIKTSSMQGQSNE